MAEGESDRPLVPALSERPGDEIDSEVTDQGELHRYSVLDPEGRVAYDQSFVTVRGEANWGLVDPEDVSSERDTLHVEILEGAGRVSLLGAQGEATEHTLEIGGEGVEIAKGTKLRYESPEGMLLRETGPEVVSPRDRANVIDVNDRPDLPDVL